MRVCLVYDHLYPHTVGGVERWFRDLALRLRDRGHDVTYLTMRHWDGDAAVDGVRVVPLTGRRRVYAEERRNVLPPVQFGAAVAVHLARHGRAYDVVHTSSFPFFPLLAAGALRRRGGYRLVVDWAEVWTRAYWRAYAGPVVGTVGYGVQQRCARIPQRAFCFSRLHAARLGRPTTVLPGLYAGPVEPAAPGAREPLVVYAGRHVREKRVPDLVRAFARAAEGRPDMRLDVFGDGPQRAQVEAAARSVDERVRVLGRRPEDEVDAAMRRAACVATASEREGYGLVVVEAAARATPSVVVAGPENAATELVEEGVNGAVAASAEPEALAAALLRVVDGGAPLRETTAAWFAANADHLRIDRSLDAVIAAYEDVDDASAREREPLER